MSKQLALISSEFGKPLDRPCREKMFNFKGQSMDSEKVVKLLEGVRSSD